MVYRDVLYGEIELPEWLGPFLRLPEIIRLRGVRLSNIDSLQYKDFGSVTRYDHAIGVVHLALRVAAIKKLRQEECAHLVLAALLHDAGTPPFGHTLELIFDDFDHEVESWNALGLVFEDDKNGFNAFDGELPQFAKHCRLLSKSLGYSVIPEAVGELINGQGWLGFLIKGSLDLDNTDNVLRGAHYMGLGQTGQLAESIAEWLATFNHPPLLEGDLPSSVRKWIEIRDEYYRLFYDCSNEEKSRQALLQFLIRESTKLGMPRERLLKSTDDGLVRNIDHFSNSMGAEAQALRDAVRKYSMLDTLPLVLDYEVEEDREMRAFKTGACFSWIESSWRKKNFVPVVFFAKRKFSEAITPKGTLFPYSKGRLSVFALYEPKKGKDLKSSIGEVGSKDVEAELHKALQETPWRSITESSTRNLKESLASWGNWAFIGSRNESLHAYPSTYVHAIPSAFIRSLRLSGELIWDPFCGSGITGHVAAQLGCRCFCSDVNEIALLISRVRNTYIVGSERENLRNITAHELMNKSGHYKPNLDNLYKWHHPETVDQLSRILGYITSQPNGPSKELLRLSFSAILTSCTARKGKQHGWFADNTPLGRHEENPPFVDAGVHFINRIERNLRILESGYSVLQRNSENVEIALSHIQTYRHNVRLGREVPDWIEEHGLGAIITSPPYLGMSDYSLGQRLSYAWLYPDKMESDFDSEIGARRRRFNKEKALLEYRSSMKAFANLAEKSIRKGGFVATVLGEPEAEGFANLRILHGVDAAMLENGFSILWEDWRPITWHRNHGYERLKKEKMTVYVKE
jgi:hypothetical protein